MSQQPLQLSKTITIKGVSYTLNAPSILQWLEVENMKTILSGNRYGEMVRAQTVTQSNTLDLIDAIAVFGVMIPELRSTWGEKTLQALPITEAKILTKAYREIHSWWTSFDAMMSDDEEDEKNGLAAS